MGSMLLSQNLPMPASLEVDSVNYGNADMQRK